MKRLPSLGTLTPVARLTKHLAVVGHRGTALYPRLDMVGLHLLNREMLATTRTDALLPLISLALLSLIKCS